mmetsp:Transcript_37754/g.94731  ORF Transcript_37754/g.94731 Transcript_37754/m.94731 type:complete len:532 (+) Transcript_37754:167-1762(+)
MVQQALIAGLSSLFFIVLNVAMNIYMKWLFDPDGGDFALPWTMLAIQQLQAYVVLQPWLAHYGPFPRGGWDVCGQHGNGDADGDHLELQSFMQVLVMTLLFCLNVGLNSVSLVQISITLNQTVRAFLPVGVLLLASVVEQRAYPSHSYATTLLLVAGIALTCWGSPDFKLYGFLLAFCSTLVAALGTSLNGRLLSKGPFGKGGPYGIARLVMLQSVPAFCIFALIAYITEGRQVREVLMDTSGRWQWYHRLGLVSFSSALALLSNLGRCFLVAATSALMETLAGNAKVAALCAIDHELFGTSLFPYNYMGIALTFSGFTMHVILQWATKESRELPTEPGSERRGTRTWSTDDDDPHQAPSHVGARRRVLTRPHLLSAADTGLVAEHFAVEMGRQLSNDSVTTNPEKKIRSITWPPPAQVREEQSRWLNVDFSLVLEAPSLAWLEGGGPRRASAVSPDEEYSPLSINSPMSRGSGFQTPPNPSARSRSFTDPTGLVTPQSSKSRAPLGAGALLTAVEEEPDEALPPLNLAPL